MKIFILLLFIFFVTVSYSQSDFAVGLNGSVNIPIGQFADFNTGYGTDFHFLYLLGNSTIFSISIGYNEFALDVERFNERAKELGINASFDLNSKFSTFPILLGAKWYFLNQKKHNLYIMLEAGIYNYDFTFSGTANLILPNGNIIPIDLEEINEMGTKSMLRISAGYIYFFAKHWFIDVGAGFNVLTDAFAVNEPVNPNDRNAIYGVVGTMNYVSIQAGLNYRF